MPNPPHTPDAKMRSMVEAMSSYGIKHEDIAKVLEIDDKTLRKHYRYELDTATAKANAQVAQRLFKKCMDGDTTSMIFWMKTRGRWKEGVDLNLGGQDGDNPIKSKLVVEFVTSEKNSNT